MRTQIRMFNRVARSKLLVFLLSTGFRVRWRLWSVCIIVQADQRFHVAPVCWDTFPHSRAQTFYYPIVKYLFSLSTPHQYRCNDRTIYIDPCVCYSFTSDLIILRLPRYIENVIYQYLYLTDCFCFFVICLHKVCKILISKDCHLTSFNCLPIIVIYYYCCCCCCCYQYHPYLFEIYRVTFKIIIWDIRPSNITSPPADPSR